MARKSTQQPVAAGDDGGNDDASRVVGDARSDSTADQPSDNGIPTFDPSTLGGNSDNSSSGGNDSASSGKRGRGRPKGSSNGKPREKEVQTSVAGIEKLLFSLHLGIAAITKQPELNLSREESKALAEAVGNVAQHYHAEVDPKWLAWFGLVGTVATVYGGKALIIRASKNKKGNKNEQPEQQQQNGLKVVPFDATALYVQGGQ